MVHGVVFVGPIPTHRTAASPGGVAALAGFPQVQKINKLSVYLRALDSHMP